MIGGYGLTKRQEAIRQRRLKQPMEELKRKADKAWNRKSNLWTQEEIDAADKRAEELANTLIWE